MKTSRIRRFCRRWWTVLMMLGLIAFTGFGCWRSQTHTEGMIIKLWELGGYSGFETYGNRPFVNFSIRSTQGHIQWERNDTLRSPKEPRITFYSVEFTHFEHEIPGVSYAVIILVEIAGLAVAIFNSSSHRKTKRTTG